MFASQIGSTISNNVELSGRSSAHVNVYDVLNAIEECTCPAADHLAPSSKATTSSNGAKLASGAANQGISMELSQNLNGGGWEGLASFLFGPDWYLIPLDGEDPRDVPSHLGGNIIANKPISISEPARKPGGKSMSTLMSSPNAPNAASMPTGKQFTRLASTPLINNTGNDKSVTFSFNRQASIGSESEVLQKSAVTLSTGRWHAPYLDNVAPFPVVSSSRKQSTANLYRLNNTSKSLHDFASEMEACRGAPITKQKMSNAKADISSLKQNSSDAPADSSPKRKFSDDGTAGSKKKMTATIAAADLARKAEAMAMREALRMPDDIIMRKDTFWGCIHQEKDDVAKMASISAKHPKAASTIHASKSALNSKPSKQTTSGQIPHDEYLVPSKRNPAYVPKFMPPFPPTQENIERDRQLCVSASKVMSNMLSGVVGSREKRKPTTVPSKPTAENKIEKDYVRQSVIELGKSTAYWGSGWQNNETKSDELSTYSIGVKSGKLPGDGIIPTDNALKEPAGAAVSKVNADSKINPLGRASGSRVSKMLEGSMN